MSFDRTSNVQILSAATATGEGEAHQPVGAKMTFQASGTTSAGSGAAVIRLDGSLDGSNYIELGSVTLTLGTTATSDGFAVDAPWTYVRAHVESISGTDASVDAYLGVER